MGFFRRNEKTPEELYWDKPYEYGMSLLENKGMSDALKARLKNWRGINKARRKQRSLAEEEIEAGLLRRRRLGGR